MNQSLSDNLNADNEAATKHSTSNPEDECFRREVGERIKNTRTGVLGVSQKEFARRLGVGISTLQRYEAGEKDPPGSFMVRLADLTGVGLDWLLRGACKLQEGDFRFASDSSAGGSGGQTVPSPESTRDAGNRNGRGETAAAFPTPNAQIGSKDASSETRDAAASPPYDRKLLMGIVLGLEDYFEREDKDPTPEQRAKLTVLMYDLFLAKGRLDQDELNSLLKIAA